MKFHRQLQGILNGFESMVMVMMKVEIEGNVMNVNIYIYMYPLYPQSVCGAPFAPFLASLWQVGFLDNRFLTRHQEVCTTSI